MSPTSRERGNWTPNCWGGLLLLHLSMLVLGCASTERGRISPKPAAAQGHGISDLLNGYVLLPARSVPVARAWGRALEENDTLWLEGLEKKYEAVLTHLALAAALGETPEAIRAWSADMQERLVERLRMSIAPAEKGGLRAWHERFIAGAFDEAVEEARNTRPSTPAGRWALRQAQALALLRTRRYMEAAELLRQGEVPLPVLERRKELLRIACLRRAGRVDEAKARWNLLADRVVAKKDNLLAGLLLDTGSAIENIATAPLDRGRIVALGEMAEQLGDLARANRAYQAVWADTRLALPPETSAVHDPVLRRAGLGILRIIAGGFGQGDASSRLRRWIEAVEKAPDTRDRAACACELLRFKGAVALRRNRLVEARSALTKALEWAERCNDLALLAKAQDDLAVVQANCGEVKEAAANSEAAQRAAEAAGDPELLYRVLQNRLVLLEGIQGSVPAAFRAQVAETGRRLGALHPRMKDR